MLSRTFLFLPGIGPTREAVLWRRGVESWGAYRGLARVPGIRPHIKARHDAVLELAEGSLGRDPAFFARLLPSPEHWRAFGAFRDGAAYIDIETTGDRANAVTVVGVRHRGENRAFVSVAGRGMGSARDAPGPSGPVTWEDYTPEAVSEFVAGATSLVTFNGATFDLPVLVNEGVKFPAVPHVDLRVVFSRLGLTGGLKKIEEGLGMGRQGELKGLTGWDAVKLWRRWEERGDGDALRMLVAYNVADFENLEPLARYATERLRDSLLADVSEGQSKLPALAT